MSIDPGEAKACRALWIAVMENAIRDALSPTVSSDQILADRWFRSGPNMLIVASMAGLDGRAVRQRYLENKIKPELLSQARQVKHAA